MELKEAFDIIDATLGMFRSLEEEVENGDLKEKFLLIPVSSYVENVYDAEKNAFELVSRTYYNYNDGGREYRRYIVDITPVCNYMVNEWPSNNAKKIRRLLNEVFSRCVSMCEDTFGALLNVALDEGYVYDRYLRAKESRNIETVMLDTIHEMNHALALTEYAEPDVTDEGVTIAVENRIISENLASQMDWVKETNNFDFNKISELIENIGRSGREKKIAIKAIYNTMVRTGEMYKIPYSVDKLLNDLYKQYDEKHRALGSLDSSGMNMNLSSFLKERDEYQERQTIEDKDIYEKYNIATNYKDNLYIGDENTDIEASMDYDLLPEELNTPEAKLLIQKLVDANLLSEDWQPVGLSIAERGYLAGDIAHRLGISAKWVIFGKLWNENPGTLRQGNIRALNQKRTSNFIEKLNNILN